MNVENAAAGARQLSVRAHDNAERVRRYDRDMDLLHPTAIAWWALR